MSNIEITPDTTSTELYREVFENHYNDYADEFARLMKEYPQYVNLIQKAWVETNTYNIMYEEFKNYLMDLTQEETIFAGQFDF